MRRSPLAKLGLIVLVSQVSAGCALLGIGTDTNFSSVPADAKQILDQVPRVENSSKSPCWQQRQIVKQQAFFDSVKKGKAVEGYAADCDLKSAAGKEKTS